MGKQTVCQAYGKFKNKFTIPKNGYKKRGVKKVNYKLKF